MEGIQIFGFYLISLYETYVPIYQCNDEYCIYLFHVQKMQKTNFSTIILLGFQTEDTYRALLFILLVVIYCVTLFGNVLIITLVSHSKSLHSPMYYFLTQLSIYDIMLTTDIVPNMLHIVLHDEATISLIGCITQFYLFGSAEEGECFILMVMSYDRYLAICKPLHYMCIMNNTCCLNLIIVSWVLSFSLSFIVTVMMGDLQFCGPNIIDHFFCDFNPILQLSCSDISNILMTSVLLGVFDLVCPLFLIILSYAYIVSVVSKISTSTGRWKSFSTCSSHLTVVCIFYGTLTATYMLPNKGRLLIISKILSMLYTVIIPFLNPFIYSLKNNDIKEALIKKLHLFNVFVQQSIQ
ncbi:olfactory receptor 11A1-like [Pseudophryne corroboree]|uniref:olfactory receptor 11A1-like n=1 Tax=Pseudophryne corroboree TaxID=495146 RepID=UPI003081BA43